MLWSHSLSCGPAQGVFAQKKEANCWNPCHSVLQLSLAFLSHVNVTEDKATVMFLPFFLFWFEEEHKGMDVTLLTVCALLSSLSCPKEWQAFLKFTKTKAFQIYPGHGDVDGSITREHHYCTSRKIEMAKKYPVDMEAAARTSSSRASKRATTW